MSTEKTTEKLVLDPVPEGVIPVDEWVPSKKETIVSHMDKMIMIPFDEVFNVSGGAIKRLNNFYVFYKDAYVKQFSVICKYINYFINFYDEDDELMTNYLAIKYLVENKKIANMSRSDFIVQLYEYMVTPSMYAKVKRMVDDNYRIDLAQKKKAGAKYYESLEFTNTHAKLLMVVSIFIRIMIPVVMHYISITKPKTEVSEHLIDYYKPLFDLIERTENINIYAKLFNSINVSVNLEYNKNKVIWDKYEAQSIDTVSTTEDFLHKNIIVDNIFKYVFNESIISFNSVIIKTQLRYASHKDFNMNFKEINTDKDSEGLSYLDKLEMSAIKMDENIILLSEVNINNSIKRIKRDNRIKISKEEIKFYTSNFKVNRISKNLIFYYYSKYFGGFNDLNHINLKQYIKLMILMKRKMEFIGYRYLPQIITANVEGRINSRTIHNAKFIERIENSSIYQNIRNEKFKTINDLDKGDLLINILSTLVNTQFTYVDFDNQELNGKAIEMDLDVLSQEFLDFVNQI